MKKKVFVGLSGGVDSSVAALLLQQAGYDVTGVFIKVWHPDFLPCNWEAERVDAMRVAAKLNIPFLTCDGEVAYRDQVASYFIESYKNGLTPNPDVLCNQEVKFGVFMKFALDHGADFVATGHYARVNHRQHDSQLLRGVDTNKDQSYFLWSLTNEQLQKVLFPVGHLQKDELRQIAAKHELPTAQKKDSQGVCFLGHVDIPEFLSHYIDLQPGLVMCEDEVIGTHQGVFVYTIGQRHGFTITTKAEERTPYYVVTKDVARNILHVSQNPPQQQTGAMMSLSPYTLRSSLVQGQTVLIQTRYRQAPAVAIVVGIDAGQIQIQVEEATEAVALGQSCVLYDGEVCLGGGMIST
jgi:tRNA-specific 2-thiouridylase